MTGQNAVDRVARGASGAFSWVGRIPMHLRQFLREIQSKELSSDTIAGPTAEERQQKLITFYAQYESLVEVLCDSAHYGPDPKLEARYSSLRKWMQESYPEIRPYVIAFVRLNPVDAKQNMDWHGVAGDAFEALFAANSLEEFLRVDDGETILRIDRTRTALNLYADHLRHLVAEESACS